MKQLKPLLRNTKDFLQKKRLNKISLIVFIRIFLKRNLCAVNIVSIFGRIIPFLAGIAVLLVLFPYSKKLNLDAEVFKFLWILVIEIYLLVFIPIFITAFIPKDLRKERFLGIILFTSELILVSASVIVILLRIFNTLDERILYGIESFLIFIYIVNVCFIFLSTKHSQKPKNISVKTDSLSWINNAQAQLENLVKKTEQLDSSYSEIKDKILKCYNDTVNLTPVNNATALKFEHQILDSVIDLISAIDQIMAGNQVNLKSKTQTLENHIRQRQNLTLY